MIMKCPKCGKEFKVFFNKENPDIRNGYEYGKFGCENCNIELLSSITPNGVKYELLFNQ